MRFRLQKQSLDYIVEEEWGKRCSAYINMNSITTGFIGLQSYEYRPGDVEEFEYNKKKYILTISAIREYEKGVGVKICVYKK